MGQYVLVAGVILLLTACALQDGQRGGADSSPDWISRPPEFPDQLCAVGVSGPTYYPEDALTQSRTAARSELARTVAVTIRAELRMEQREHAGTRMATSVEELATFASTVILKLAQVRQHWVDPGHRRLERKGTVYTLLCMPRDISSVALREAATEPVLSRNPRFPILLQQTQEIIKTWSLKDPAP